MCVDNLTHSQWVVDCVLSLSYRLNLMYVHFDEGDPLKLVVLNKRLQFAATHKLGVLLGVDCAKVGRRGGEGRGGKGRGEEGRKGGTSSIV